MPPLSDWRVTKMFDGCADPTVATAATDVSRHTCVDILVLGPRRAHEQRGRRHNLSALTVTALRYVQREPALLDSLADGRFADAFDGSDPQIDRGLQGQLARASRRTIRMYGARAALSDSATEFGARHVEDIAQYPQQRRIALGVHVVLNAIYFDGVAQLKAS
jgi:hypothetical protein